MNFGALDDFSESTFFFLVWDVVSSALLRFLSDELPMVVFAGYSGAGVVKSRQIKWIMQLESPVPRCLNF